MADGTERGYCDRSASAHSAQSRGGCRELRSRTALQARRSMADHLDSPNLTSPAMDARVDITDIYAFQKPGDINKSILILNVNPLAPTHADEFRHDARYELLIDNNADAQPDVKFSIRFSKKQDGHQVANVRRTVSSNGSDDGGEDDSDDVIEDAPVSFGSASHVTTSAD